MYITSVYGNDLGYARLYYFTLVTCINHMVSSKRQQTTPEIKGIAMDMAYRNTLKDDTHYSIHISGLASFNDPFLKWL